MANLHEAGWRQGCLIEVALATRTYTVIDGATQSQDVEHDVWLLAEQDCDLRQTEDSDVQKLFELRAVRIHNGDVPSSITGIQVRIDGTRSLMAMDHTVKVTAAWLTAHIAQRKDTANTRRREVKTWLGYRYDRPAVPEEFLQIHSRIGELAKKKRGRPDPSKPTQLPENWPKISLNKVRDVLVAYEVASQNGKIRASVFAIANDPGDVDEIQEWIERVRDDVGADESFVIAEVTAADTDGMPISVLEKAFSLYGDTHSLQTAT